MNALVVYERMNELTTAARALHTSGYFTDVKSEAQAMVKVLAGAEIGLPAFASMSGIHIVQGKPVLGANLVATLVKNDPRYNYRVKRADNEVCILTWYEGGEPVGESSFTMQEATAAGLTNKDNWRKYPSDMLFARALTRGARRFAPGIFGGAPIYTPDEMGVETDEEGQIVQGEIIDVTPAENPARPAPATGNGGTQPAAPKADPPARSIDEVFDEDVAAATVSEFVPTVARILEIGPDAVKERIKLLGYTSISGKPAERVNMFHALRDNKAQKNGNAQPAQAAMPLEDTDAAKAAVDSAAGLFD